MLRLLRYQLAPMHPLSTPVRLHLPENTTQSVMSLNVPNALFSEGLCRIMAALQGCRSACVVEERIRKRKSRCCAGLCFVACVVYFLIVLQVLWGESASEVVSSGVRFCDRNVQRTCIFKSACALCAVLMYL